LCLRVVGPKFDGGTKFPYRRSAIALSRQRNALPKANDPPNPNEDGPAEFS
jgi:hypothetical protein